MKFTGTLIEDLVATVERAERRAQPDRALPAEPRMEPPFVESFVVEPLFVESSFVEPWFASVQKSREYNSKFIGVA